MPRRPNLDAALDAVDDVRPLSEGRGLRGLIGVTGSALPEMGTETELSSDETLELERCETIIQRGLKTFFEVGAALLRIRDLRLYRTTHATFEDYCQLRWELGRRYVNQIIAASQVHANLGAMAPKQLPSNERQARPLTKLPDPALQREAWQQAVATAPDGRITAAHVAQVVQQFLREAEPAPLSTPAPPATVIDVRPLDATEPPTLAAVQARNAELEQRLATVQAILAAYQAQIAQAQAYPPDSAQGAAVAPLLQALEQVQRELATHAWSARDPKGVPSWHTLEQGKESPDA